MAVKSIIPETNVLAVDVRDTLRHHGGSVTDDVSSYFAEAAKINPMAKYKPVRYSADHPSRDVYYKANDGLMGFKVTSYSSYTQIPNAMDGNMNGWVYQLPRGGAYNEPFRLGDFRGYDPNADSIVAEQYVTPTEVKKGDKFYVEASVPQSGSTGIQFSDFTFLSNYYFGVYIKGTTTGQWVVTDDTPVGNDLISVEVDTTNFPTGTYTIYPFLSKNKITQTTSYTASNTYYTIPMMGVMTVKVAQTTSTEPKISVEAYIPEGSTTTVNYQFRVYNGTPGTIITGIVVKIRRYDKAYNDALLTYEYQTTLSNVTLGSDGTYTSSWRTATINSSLYNYGAKIYVRGVYSNGSIEMIGESDVAVEQPE